MKKLNVFGHEVTVFDGVSDAAKKILDANCGKPTILTALNPEKVEKARTSSELKNVLDNSDILYPDGIGIVKAIGCKYNIKTNRVPGCELWEEIIKSSYSRGLKVYLVGAQPSVIENTVTLASQKYKANIVGYTHGINLDEKKVIEDIISSGAEFVSVAMGTPKQELFIIKCKEMGVNALMMGVGGTYDVFTGNVKRAPRFWCNMKLEWLFRLLSQPTRLGRQVNLVKFLLRLVLRKY
ncbi:WecB/TagA/CpsF family glycosyltransferase [Pseudoalteromonas piscicida]|uniref:WecB/TagA/CpsF family glycosyltransferase n=1 Tax=Pseudoalteromonas piscicida TaxID=43662 RepID=UPI0030B3B69F